MKIIIGQACDGFSYKIGDGESTWVNQEDDTAEAIQQMLFKLGFDDVEIEEDY